MMISKRLMALAAVLAIVCVAGLVSAGCAGAQAQQRVLGPAAAEAWRSVRLDVEKGLAEGVSTGELSEGALVFEVLVRFDTSVEVKAPDPTSWTVLHPWALRGIDARVREGTLGALGAGSLRERLRLFTAAQNGREDASEDGG